jgi:hypothetical protein
MLNRDCEEILFDEQKKFVGIKSQGEVNNKIYNFNKIRLQKEKFY